MKPLLLALLPLTASAASLSIQPPRIVLHGPHATQLYTVTFTDNQGYEHDVTTECASPNPARATMRAVAVSCRGLRATAPVIIAPAARAPGISFVNDVSPIFTMSGCAGANCHGSLRGQRGFKLSLFGVEPKLDFDAVAAQRINRQQPEQSLLLKKATAETGHGGGLRFAADSLQYRTIRDWIAQGAPYDQDDSVRAVSLRVYPEERILLGPQQKQQLIAVATYSDGSVRDVTRLVQYSSNGPDTAQVTANGVVTALEAGETAIMVRTMGQAVAARILVAAGPTAADYPRLAANNFVDEHIFSKLRRLNIRPSGPATDSEFLRRVYLDTVGLLPTEADSRRFLASTAPDKRRAEIDRLLNRREFAELWALKFTELFRAGTREAGAKGARIVYNFIRDSFLANKPYDRFVREILLSQGAHSFAASSQDGLPNAPTSFYNISFDSNAPDHATNISQLFLGVRLECAKCHNHPWEKWTQDDFYGFAAFFARVGIKEVYENDENATQYMEEGAVEHPKTRKKMVARVLDGKQVPDSQDADIREELAAWMTAPDNPYFARTMVNRVWKHYFGRGFVEEVDDFRVTNPPSHPALLDALARDFAAHRFDLRHLMRTILNSRAYQLSAEPSPSNRSDTINFSRFPIRRLLAETLLDTMSQATGVPEKFPGYPPGTRAMQVYAAGAGGYLLSSFGRLSRDILCERDAQPDMAQTMHLISGATLQNKITQAAFDPALSNEQLLEQIYLRSLVRLPSAAERTAVLAMAKAGDRRKVFEDLLWAILNSKEFLYQH